MTRITNNTRTLMLILSGIVIMMIVSASIVYGAEEDGYTENGLYYSLNADSSSYSIEYGGTDSIVYIPETINGLPVTAVHEAFQDNDTVTEVIFPETVTEVSIRCFENCSNLRKIHMGGVKKVVPAYSDWEVIDNCKSLESLTFGPNAELVIEEEGTRRFSCIDSESWNHLKHISISGKMSSVPESFFYGKSLQTIEIGSGHPTFSSIDNMLYSSDGKTLLVCGTGYTGENYVIPEGVTTIGHIGFDSCSNIRTITIPRSVTTINHAFANTSVTLHVYKGSAGEEYAAKYGMDYRICKESGVLETPVTGITLNRTEVTMQVGDTLKLEAICSPAQADDQTVKWDSIFPGIADVTSDGTVTAKSSGTGIIVASASGGYDVTATCRITVEGGAEKPTNPDATKPVQPTEPSTANPAPTEPTPDDPNPTEPDQTVPAPVEPSVEQKAQTITGSSAFTKTYGSKAFRLGAAAKTSLTYKSSNANIVSVNAKGLVTLKAPGRAVITITAAATSDYKAATKKVTITVKPKQMTALKAKSAAAKTLRVSWKKDTKITGYQIIIAQDSKFRKGRKTANITKNKTTSATFKNLAKGKTYYIKARAYKTISGQNYYGSFSKITSAKIKGGAVSNNKYNGYYIKYFAEEADDAPHISVHIKKVANGKITFGIGQLGRNYSPIYETEYITTKLKNKKASFKWTDSWGNSGKGTLTIGAKTVKLNLKQTKTSEWNRSSLDTNGTITLKKK